MATVLSTSYVGEYKDKMIAAALLSGKTLDNGGVTVYPNVAYKEVVDENKVFTVVALKFKLVPITVLETLVPRVVVVFKLIAVGVLIPTPS